MLRVVPRPDTCVQIRQMCAHSSLACGPNSPAIILLSFPCSAVELLLSRLKLAIFWTVPARYSGPRSARRRRATTRQTLHIQASVAVQNMPLSFPFFPCLAVELLPPRLKLAIFWTVPARYKWATLRAAASCHDPQEVMAPAVADPQALGLAKLYRLMLDHVNL